MLSLFFSIFRACKICIDEALEGREAIICPFDHDVDEPIDLAQEPCQKRGLQRGCIVLDAGSERVLLAEKCFCRNREFGCTATPKWIELYVIMQLCNQTSFSILNCSHF